MSELMLVWCADSPKQSIEERIAEGRDAYIQRIGIAPKSVLVNEDEARLLDAFSIPWLKVVPTCAVKRGMYWLCG